MFKFRANLGFKFHSCKKLRVKIAIFSKKVFENRDFMSKKREITNFKHKIIKSKQLYWERVISLHQKKILMVKVYG